MSAAAQLGGRGGNECFSSHSRNFGKRGTQRDWMDLDGTKSRQYDALSQRVTGGFRAKPGKYVGRYMYLSRASN